MNGKIFSSGRSLGGSVRSALLGQLAVTLILLGAAPASAGTSSQIIGAGPPVNRQTATLQIRQLDNLDAVASGNVSEMVITKPTEPNRPLNESVPHPRKSIGSASETGVTLVFVLDNTLRDAGLRGAGKAVGDAVRAMMDTTRGDAVGVAIVDKQSSQGALYLPPSKDPNEVMAFINAHFNGLGTQSPIMTTTRSIVEKLANDLQLPPRREIVLVSDGKDENCQSEADPAGCLERSIQAIAASAESGDIPVAVSTIGINSLRTKANVDLRWLSGLEALAKRLHGVSTAIDPSRPSDLSDEVRHSFERARSVYLFELSCITEPPLRDGSVALEARGTSRAETTDVSLKGLHCDAIGAVCDRVPACAAAAPPPPAPGTTPPPAAPTPPPESSTDFSGKQWAGIALALVAIGLIVWLVLRSKKQKALEAKQAQLAADQRRRDAESAAAAAFAAAQPGFNAQANQPVRPLAGPTSMEQSGGRPSGTASPRSAADGLRAWRSDVDGPHLAILAGGRVSSVRIGASPVAIGVGPDGSVAAVPERDASAVLLVARDSGVGITARATRAGLNMRKELDQSIVESQTQLAPGTLVSLPGGALIESRLVDPASGAPFASRQRREAWRITPASSDLARLGQKTIGPVPLLLGRQPDPRHDCDVFDLSMGGSEPAASKVSGNHARLWVSGGYLFVADAGSSNGTFLNGNRLHPNQPVVVQAGDRISFSSNIHFVAGDA